MSLAPEAIGKSATETPAAQRTRRGLMIWLLSIAALLVGMIVLGGATRLTESGLSITEWRPVTGVVPPLSEAAWQSEFEKYQRIPQYEHLFPEMTLSDFKIVYWWEWSHRLLGRIIGAAVFFPLVFFWVTGRIGPRLRRRLFLILLLGGMQAALGWYMVQSGLSERIAVSQYRLAAHLALAFIIYGAVLATIFGLLWAEPRARRGRSLLYGALVAFLGLVFLQIVTGAFMAGTDAGLTDNTWPLVDGRLIPTGLLVLDPWWRNPFENVTMIQFVHRTLAYLVVFGAVYLWAWTCRIRAPMMTLAANALLGIVALQVALGIATLLAVVPLTLALLHQLGAIAVFSAALFLLKAARACPQTAPSA